MIAEISAWIKGIVLIVMFATFLELLLPNSSMQRFIRVVMGLFIMLAILNPVLSVLEKKMMPEQVPTLSASQQPRAIEITRAANAMTAERDRLARELYRKELAKQIKATIQAIDGVSNAQVEVKTKDSEEQGNAVSIETVSIYVSPSPAAGSNAIAKVTIGPKEAAEAEIKARTKDKIRQTITELYQLRDNQIEIKRLN